MIQIDQNHALREALEDIANTKNLTATPAQFIRHLQTTAAGALVTSPLLPQQGGEQTELMSQIGACIEVYASYYDRTGGDVSAKSVAFNLRNNILSILRETVSEYAVLPQVGNREDLTKLIFNDWPEYSEQGMGCGLEDRDITDCYEAMRYGWDQAIELVGERIDHFCTVLPQVGERSKFELTEEMRTALDAANKAGKAYAILPDGALMTINRGEQPEDTSDLDCPHCGGSGHKDDVKVASRSDSSEFGIQVGEAKPIFPNGLIERLRIHADNKDNTAFARSTMREVLEYVSASAGLGEEKAVARLLHWAGPRHSPIPHGGIAARTYAEFSEEEANKPGSYWKNGAPLYAAPVAQALPVVAENPLLEFAQHMARQKGEPYFASLAKKAVAAMQGEKP